MRRIFLYNPENDIALAHQGPGAFTPPAAALRLAQNCAAVMGWLGDGTDYLLVPGQHLKSVIAWHDKMESAFGSLPKPIACWPDAGNSDDWRCEPWGWSHYVLNRFLQAGVPVDVVSASAPCVDTLQRLSHRRISSEINVFLRDKLARKWGSAIVAEPAVEIDSVEKFRNLAERLGRFYVKSPWSSSGRGVVCSSQYGNEELCRRIAGTIRRQGSVLVESAKDKLIDFAMLFCCRNRLVRYVGLSLFFTGDRGGYGGNIIMPDAEIECELSRCVPQQLLNDVRNGLKLWLTETVAPHYNGYLGVDMMIARNGSDDTCALVPCVELNLRTTMGVIAHEVGRRVGCNGIMQCAPGDSSNVKGALLSLVPPNKVFNITLASPRGLSGPRK